MVFVAKPGRSAYRVLVTERGLNLQHFQDNASMSRHEILHLMGWRNPALSAAVWLRLSAPYNRPR